MRTSRRGDVEAAQDDVRTFLEFLGERFEDRRGPWTSRPKATPDSAVLKRCSAGRSPVVSAAASAVGLPVVVSGFQVLHEGQ